MIDQFTIDKATIHVTRFTPDEEATGQISAQGLAVTRLLRHALGSDTTVMHRPDGSPFIDGLDSELSVSHCNGYAAIGLHDGPRFGIDIERPRAPLQRVAHKFLSADEMLRYVTPDDLLRAWTVKEALYKAAGLPGVSLADGLMLPPTPSSDTAYVKKDGIAVPYKISSFTYDDCIISVALPVNGQ